MWCQPMLELSVLARPTIRGLRWCLVRLVRSSYFFFELHGLHFVTFALAFTMRPPFRYLYPGFSIHILPAAFFLVAMFIEC
jgi:hypothetical protein